MENNSNSFGNSWDPWNNRVAIESELNGKVMGQAQPNLSDQRDRESQYDEFVALLSFHDRAIRRFIRSLLPSSDAVDDVVQETALECWKKYSDFQSLGRSRSGGCDRGTEFVRWAFVIARFKVLSHQRDKARERLVFRDSVIAKLAETADLVAERESDERQAIENCLQKLPEDQRRLVLSFYLHHDLVHGFDHAAFHLGTT